MIRVRRVLEGIYHIHYVAFDDPETELVDIIAAVAKDKNSLRSWPGPWPDSRKQIRQMMEQGGLRVSVSPDDENTTVVRRGKRFVFLMIRKEQL